MAIDVGASAINRAGIAAGEFTYISAENPANLTGNITEIKTYVDVSLTGCFFGIFELISDTTFKCRSAVDIGVVATGLVSHVVNLAVVAGDYIGIWWSTSSGKVDRNDSGGAGYWYIGSVNHCIVDDQATYTLSSGRILSLEGIGVEVSGWTGKLSGVTNPAKIMGIAVADIAKVNGVA